MKKVNSDDLLNLDYELKFVDENPFKNNDNFL